MSQPKVIATSEKDISDFIAWNQKEDLFAAQAADEKPAAASLLGLSFLRIELLRIRPGMADYLMRVSTPKTKDTKQHVIVTLRGNKRQGTPSGAAGTARVIVAEMKKKEDKSHKWEGANTEHLAKMLLAPLKFFAVNTNCQKVLFTTEALR